MNNVLRRILRGVAPLVGGVLLGVAPAGAAASADAHYVRAGFATPPHFFYVHSQETRLHADSPAVRRRAAESLGFLRARTAAPALARALAEDPQAEVRREAVLALAWCGGRAELGALQAAMADPDWSVRQSAWVALCNLTGMEFPYDALATENARREQAATWRTFLDTIPAAGAPAAVLDLLRSAPRRDLAAGGAVTASSTYKGPPGVLTGGDAALFWQTKEVAFPQHCTIDLGGRHEIGEVVVEQYGPGYCMTDAAILTSLDGTNFQVAWEQKRRTEPRLKAAFARRPARYVRIVSHAAENARYPTTFYRVFVFEEASDSVRQGASPLLGVERGLRALGVFGGMGASKRISETIEATRRARPEGEPTRLLILAGLRSLGRLGDADAIRTLTAWLDDPYWARYAADALGDCGTDAVVPALVDAYPGYARNLDGKEPARVPPDDRPGFESFDRAYETPFAIASALARLPLKTPEAVAAVRRIAPRLLANLPADFDGAMLYEPEAHPLIVAYLLERTGLRAAVRDVCFAALDQPPAEAASASTLSDAERKALTVLARSGPGGTSVAANWLTVLCRPGESTASLTRLLEHTNGWVRINAAKALLFTGERAAAEPLARLLSASKPEAAYGYFGRFLFTARQQGQDEYNAPSPCWREAFTRALGELGGPDHVALLTRLLTDDRNVLEVQYAAAQGLDDLGTPEAMNALRQAAGAHPFHSIRLLAREALWRRNLTWDAPGLSSAAPVVPPAVPAPPPVAPDGRPAAIVFIKGENDMPNDFQIDIWRQTYSTTDSGPTYRLGRNLYVLSPVAPDGKVTPLTRFTDGYVADCEVSWDGRRILFARRGGDADPWWHLYEIEADGTGLRQLTFGPYHDVQPDFLPDGRIVFASSRIGLRDEYHGYPATGLTVMNADGSGIHCIGFNVGRDNEPSLLPDGRIVFSRLELFYSRLKTELTVQAVHPDGTKNVTLYGPERRAFWQAVTKQSLEKWWGEVPPRHRVLRLTQPQAFDRDRILCASTGGPVLIGPGRLTEAFVPRQGDVAVTSPYPLDGERILCAATRRMFKPAGVDLGLYSLNARTGALTLIYNDPATAEFEARPLRARTPPPVLAAPVREGGFAARLFCSSARTSQEALTRERGKLVRIVEGRPVPSRHFTHTSSAGEAWKNHVGTDARVLGTVPLAADGSFFVEVPADRLIHCQVLDADRNVVGNQLIWMYARPDETRSCIGCHEIPDGSPPLAQGFAASARMAPLRCLPTGGEFAYRAKVWQKGELRPETEERTRTVQAINLPGR